MRRNNLALVLTGLLSITGCSLAPDYAPPSIDIGEQYREVKGWKQAGTDVPSAGKWWEMFNDPRLNGLEERLSADNPSLAAASARYAQAMALIDRTSAAELPSVDLSAGASNNRVSAERPLTSGKEATYKNYAVGPSLSYEFDLFGRVRNGVKADEAGADAARFDREVLLLGLQVRLASSYFDLKGLDERLGLLRETVEAYKRARDLIAARCDDGYASGMDMSRAENQLANAKVELDVVQGQRDRAEHAIAALQGLVPSRFRMDADRSKLEPPKVSPGVPSTLLERRPDISAAERRMAAANAQIGVARAAMYPQITLGGSFGFQSTYGDLFQASNSFWALGPLAGVLSLFDNGARQANVEISRDQYDEAAANYRQTVLTAFREVEDDLATSRQYEAQEAHQRQAAEAAKHTLDLALSRYQNGASSYLEVVTAQTASLDADRALIDLHSQQLALAADMVRAVGGAPAR